MFTILFFSVLTILMVLFVWSAYKAHRVDWGPSWFWIVDGTIRLVASGYKKGHLQKPDLPLHGGGIILSHQQTWLDPLLLIAATDRPIRFLVPTKMYQKKWLNKLFVAFGAIEVSSNTDEEVIRAVLTATKAGEVVACFQAGCLGCGETNTSLRETIVRLVSHQSVLLFPVKVMSSDVDKKVWMPGGASVACSAPMTCRKQPVEELVDRVNQFLSAPVATAL
ncbi:MAG: hypothetical protein HOM11_18300 [Methylococcales bacterium]|jgi:1-acyl-sn-glycerol-3-phosphate acyltransferase|nr:hypothetical protein [Methylococcales bacterium]MBT7443062.1 hypothetical protein [Methylococcales bacterium]